MRIGSSIGSFQRVGIAPALAAYVIVAAFLGCGDSGPKVVAVSGRVTRHGKPVPNLTISFVPQGGGRPSQARLDQDGRFKLVHGLDKDGAEVGTHTVSVSFPPSDPGEEIAMIEGTKKLPPEVIEVLTKYGNPESSPLKVEITQAKSDLEIKLD